MSYRLNAYYCAKRTDIWCSEIKKNSSFFLIAALSTLIYTTLFKPVAIAQGYSTQLPQWVMTLEEIESARQQWSMEGNIPHRKLLTRNSIRAHFGIKLTNPNRDENKKLITWWSDTDQVDVKPDDSIQNTLIDMAYASGHLPVSEIFLRYQESSFPTAESDNTGTAVDTTTQKKYITGAFNNLNRSHSGRFDLIVGNADIYQILIVADLQNNTISVIFPDAGVLHLKAAQEELDLTEQLHQTEFFQLLSTLLGESGCNEISYTKSEKKPKRKKKRPKPFSGKDIGQYHPNYQKDHPIFAQDKWCKLSTGERPSYWLLESDHSAPVHLIANTEGLSQLHRLQTQTRNASDYLYNALCYALYSMRVGLITPNLPPENRNWKLEQIDAMLSEQLRFALCTNTEKNRQIWREKYEHQADSTELMLFWTNISNKIRLSRQWSFCRSLIITLITPNESIYLQIRDLPVFSVIMVLPGELLFYHETSMEESIVGIDKHFTPGDPLLAEIWNELYKRYEQEVGKFRVIATFSDSLGSGFGLPAKSKYPGVWKKMQDVATLTECPFPQVFPSLETRRRHLVAARKITPQLSKLMAVERREIDQAERIFVQESLASLSPLQHYTKDLKLTTFDTLFTSCNKPYYTRLGLAQLEQFAEALPKLNAEEPISADLATLLTIPATPSHITHMWSHACKLVKKEEEKQAKKLLTETAATTVTTVTTGKIAADNTDSISQPPAKATQPEKEKVVANVPSAGDGVDVHQVFPQLEHLPVPAPPPVLGAPPPPPPPLPVLGSTFSNRKTLVQLRVEWNADKANKVKTNKYKSALASGWKASKSTENADWYIEYLQHVLPDMDPGCQEMLKSFSILVDIVKAQPDIKAGDIHLLMLDKYKKSGKMRASSLPLLMIILGAKFSTKEMLALLQQQAESVCYSGQLESIIEKELIGIWQRTTGEKTKSEESNCEATSAEQRLPLSPAEQWQEKVKQTNLPRYNAMRLYYQNHLSKCEGLPLTHEKSSTQVAAPKQELILQTVWNFGPLSDILMGITPLNMLQRSTAGGFNILNREIVRKGALLTLSEGDIGNRKQKMQLKSHIREMLVKCLDEWHTGLEHESAPDDDITARIMRLSKPSCTAFAEEHGSFYLQLEKEWIEKLSAAFTEAAQYYDKQGRYADSAKLLSEAAHLTTAYRETLMFEPKKWESLIFEAISPLPGFSAQVKKEQDFCNMVDAYVCSLSALTSAPKCRNVCQHLKENNWDNVLKCIESAEQKTGRSGLRSKKANTPASQDTDKTNGANKTNPFNVTLKSTRTEPATDGDTRFVPRDYLLSRMENACKLSGITFDQSEKNALLEWLQLQSSTTQRDIEYKVNSAAGKKAAQRKLKRQFKTIIGGYSNTIPDDVGAAYIDSAVRSGTSCDMFKLGINDLLQEQIHRLRHENDTLRQNKGTGRLASDPVPLTQTGISISESSEDDES